MLYHYFLTVCDYFRYIMEVDYSSVLYLILSYSYKMTIRM
jgi:hypothetical protein